MNRVPFGFGEWYHCYSRGVDKRVVFDTPADYRRFLELLYLSNGTQSHWRSAFQDDDVHMIFSSDRSEPIVAIGAYCLMPNHFHLLIQELTEGGITLFMRRLGTAYTMYFNKKNDRVGNLFVKPFRSKHIVDDRYFRHVANYIHLNPAELSEPGWKEGRVQDIKRLGLYMNTYSHSSFIEYLGKSRPESAILDKEAFSLLSSNMSPVEEMLSEASAYYLEVGASLQK